MILCPDSWWCKLAIGFVGLQLVACTLLLIVGWIRARRHDETHGDFE